MDRDEELDELEAELHTPYIEEPEELDEGAGQTCFLDGDRRCMPDCTAFNVYAEVQQGPERCVFLVYLANSAVDSHSLVALGKKIAGQYRMKAADEARVIMASSPIPDPFGGKT